MACPCSTGATSPAPVWLEELGYGRPVAEKVTVGVGYASRSYRLPSGALGKDRLMLHGWTPD
ncbi:MAG: monooxygenase FAD-binding [Actinomycetia bacterium]|nr:monooxygenase FAD-binding [Actinomycetes bacterium]